MKSKPLTVQLIVIAKVKVDNRSRQTHRQTDKHTRQNNMPRSFDPGHKKIKANCCKLDCKLSLESDQLGHSLWEFNQTVLVIYMYMYNYYTKLIVHSAIKTCFINVVLPADTLSNHIIFSITRYPLHHRGLCVPLTRKH